MRRRVLAAAAWCLAAALPAAAQQEAQPGSGAVLRGLDKINGEVHDFEMANATSARLGSLRIELGECRYPAGDPAADAFAFLSIYAKDDAAPIFSGWMVASSPALNPLEHPRYDVWVLRCKTE